MDPKSFCPMCGKSLTMVDKVPCCFECKVQFIIVDDSSIDNLLSDIEEPLNWEEEFFNSEDYKRLRDTIMEEMGKNMKADNETVQKAEKDLLNRESYARNMLEDDDLGEQDEFPEALDSIMSAYEKYKT